MPTFTYNFTATQPLNQEQIDYIEKALHSLPYHDKENFLDLPESISLNLELVVS